MQRRNAGTYTAVNRRANTQSPVSPGWPATGLGMNAGVDARLRFSELKRYYISTQANTIMFIPSFTVTPPVLTAVEQIGRAVGFLQAVRLPPDFARELLATVEAETIHASTAIEGNTLTQEQVTQVLRGQTVLALARDVHEVKNYQATLAYIHELATVTTAFTHQTILELHYRLLQGCLLYTSPSPRD